MALPMVQVNVRVPPELHERLIAEVSNTGTTVTAVVTRALEQYLTNDTNGGKTK